MFYNFFLLFVSPLLFLYSFVDFIIYNITNVRLPLSYRIFRKTFISSGGKFNDYISKYISRFHQRISASEMGNLIDLKLNLIEEEKDFLDSMKLNGFYVFGKRLSIDQITLLQKKLNELPDYYYDNETGEYQLKQNLENFIKEKKSIHDLWSSKIIRDWALNRDFIYLAQVYLNSLPICDLLSSWKSRPSNDFNSRNRAAQFYHFDMDRIKFIKFFIYLTDVNSKNGPHCYIRGSHKLLNFKLRRDGRFQDSFLKKYFNDSDFIEIKGLKGSIIAVDTRGFHKGKPLCEGHREIFQVQYTNSLFGNDEYDKIDSDNFNFNSTESRIFGA